jgi:hypothetical protein
MIRNLNRPKTEGMRILFTAAELAARVEALAAEIAHDPRRFRHGRPAQQW